MKLSLSHVKSGSLGYNPAFGIMFVYSIFPNKLNGIRISFWTFHIVLDFY